MEMVPTKSYRDKLLGVIPGAFAQMCTSSSQQYGEEDSDSEVDEVTKGFAAVKLSKKPKLGLEAPGITP